MPSPPGEVTLFLAGDVMTGRGIDQILPHPGQPELRESFMKHAMEYVALAASPHGAVPAPVAPAYIWGTGLAVLERMRPQLSIVNLETAITTSGDFWPRKPVHYRMHPANIACLTVARLDVCTLANNHALDFGHSGLIETIETLHGVRIQTAGAGRDLAAASQPVRVPLGDQASVLVFGIGSESSGIPQSWAAGVSSPGVHLAPDLSLATADAITEHIRAHKGPGDIAVVSVHWGSNWGYEISDAQVAFAHRLVDGGADLVHGHSSHHVRSIELYRGKLILYGCGDLITDYEGIRGHEAWRGDLAAMYFATLASPGGRLIRLVLVPMQMKRLQLTRANADDTQWLLDTLNRISHRFGSRFEHDVDGVRVAHATGG